MKCYFENELLNWLKRSKMTKRALAARLEVSERQIYYYLTGHSIPSPRVAIALSKLTGIPLETILTVWEQE